MVKSLTGSIVKTSKGTETLEICLNGNIRASVPEGTSKGELEARCVKPEEALKKIKELNLEALDDEFLIKNKAYLGANTALAISIALVRLKAKENKQELWEYIEKISNSQSQMPKLLVNCIEGGSHAENNLKIQEYLLVCETIKQAKEIWQDLKNQHPGLPLGMEGGLAGPIDDPIELLKKYHLPLGVDAAGEEVLNYSDLYYLEDPKEFKLIKDKLIVGDDLTVTRADLIEKYKDKINGVIIKPNQVGTISETLAAIKKARELGMKVIVSHRSGETEDSFISDLAYGIGADMIKLGTYEQKERKAKYDRLEEIIARV